MRETYKTFLSRAIAFALVCAGLLISSSLYSRDIDLRIRLKWLPDQKIRTSETDSILRLGFDGAVSEEEYGLLPVYSTMFRLTASSDSVFAGDFREAVYEPIPDEIIQQVRDIDKVGTTIEIRKSILVQRKIPYVSISFLPMRRDPVSGRIERLVSFRMTIHTIKNESPVPLKPAFSYAANSVLQTGAWYKLKVTANGIYKITYADLVSLGMTPASVNPKNIRIYGNGGGMLPESNAAPKTDDLRENAIVVSGEEDGQFNDGDFILFYGESPDKWSFNRNTNQFRHQKNIYAEETYYFLTADLGPGKRLGYEGSTSAPATATVNTFNDFQFYEKDGINLIKSGKAWFDQEIFDVTTSREYNTFNFPNINSSFHAIVTADVVSRCTSVNASFDVSANGQKLMNISVPPVTSNYLDTYAIEKLDSADFYTGNPQITVKLDYKKQDYSAIGYLNYLEINATRNLIMSGNQMAFRSIASMGKNKVSEFILSGTSSTPGIWDVTDPENIKVIGTSFNGSNTVFRLPTDTLREFVAYDGSSYLTPVFVGKQENQDLHGCGAVDYVIVTNPLFMDQAQKLADFHRSLDHLTVLVTTPEKIYNEFSCGSQDVTAIRNFIKMLYDKASPAKEPKYLLFFGDASYDYKDRMPNNTNYVPSFESAESLNPVSTYVTDDYFVLLDDNEGQGASGLLDVGVGRFPVKSVQEAEEALAKIQHYCSQTDTVKNDWRNVVCFIADDKDDPSTNIHMEQADQLGHILDTDYKDYNVDKIYLDAYEQISTPGGARYPDINEAINRRVDKGALIINYTGHGGELGWAHERVLEIADIKSWKNFDRLATFVTATCEFSRFDDPSWTSAGEWVFLNPSGGGIALFTTTRPTFAGDNFVLSSNFYNNAFKKINGVFPKMGDLIMAAKNSTGSQPNSRKFILLGDPALQLAYPQYHIFTTAINQTPVSSVPDTLKALSLVTISGEVRDDDGNKMTSFNGILFPTVFDKASEVYTLANDGGSAAKFFLRKNPLYKGKVAVTGGTFSFSFIVPKDIAYKYGFGKISYYARDPNTDANGYDENIIVGGFDDRNQSDPEGPVIDLFMNDVRFVSGGITDENPILLAFVADTTGINTVGNGIGHDITAVLDGNSKDAKILNDYYVSGLDTYKNGSITYPFYKLTNGKHQLTLKVWDVYNNSAEASIDFVVASSGEFILQHLMNFPNPFSDHTTFSFEYNQPNISMDVEISIFNLGGRKVKTIHQEVSLAGYRCESIRWDGRSDDGSILSTGMYVYYLKAKLPDGSSAEQSSKLIYLR